MWLTQPQAVCAFIAMANLYAKQKHFKDSADSVDTRIQKAYSKKQK